jgi:hypothetical protein
MKVELHKFCSKSLYQTEVGDKFQAQAPLLPSILPQQLNSHFTGNTIPSKYVTLFPGLNEKFTLLGTN